ncbi:MAG: hypothetical protein ABIP42_15535, partial [Planctomycetota bacterium]
SVLAHRARRVTRIATTTEAAGSGHSRPVRGAWVIGGILAGTLLFHGAARRSVDFAPDDVALGRNTVAFTARFDERQIGGPIPELPEVLKTAQAAREAGRPLVLWLGASQLYAINRPKAGDRTAVVFAAEQAQARGSSAAWVQCASPNSNAHELLCMYIAFRQARVVPDRLVLAFTYDDLKEPGIRDSALSLLSPLDEETLRTGAQVAVELETERARIVGGLAREAATTPVVRTATSGTPQERLEDAIEGWLDAHWSAWAARGNLAAEAVTWWKMPVTTLAFRVFDRPQTVVPPERAAWNWSALMTLLDLARADGVRVLVYQAPHNPGLEPFYHPRAAYDRAQAEMARACQERHFDWIGLETLVPAGLWGETNNFTPDVFHFQVEGHRLLGERIEAAVAERDG